MCDIASGPQTWTWCTCLPKLILALTLPSHRQRERRARSSQITSARRLSSFHPPHLCFVFYIQELNKRLTAHVSSLLNCLRGLLCPLLEGQKNSSTSFSCQFSHSTLILHVKSELSGLPFHWDFHCCAASVEMVS